MPRAASRLPDACELCGVDAAYNFHHLIPRTLHSNKWFKRRYSRAALQQGLHICKLCHQTIHAWIPEKKLGRSFSTREALLAHEEIAKYVAWKRRRLNHAAESPVPPQTPAPQAGSTPMHADV